ncbi:MAG TPA: hypothetical protein VHM88_17060, partial [Candidatus Acidoferrales bacterium]|nr:hypothetical protein [Candidatus Acidoferrales bacterium]
MARALKQSELPLYRQTLRSVWWKRISGGIHLADRTRAVMPSWWWLWWIVLWVALAMLRTR